MYVCVCTVYNLFLTSIYWQDMSQSCQASTPSWKKLSRKAVDLATPMWSWSPYSMDACHFNYFFSIIIVFQRSHNYKAFPNHYNH